MSDSVGGGGFPRNINIGHEHLNLIDGLTYQYQGDVPTNVLNWKIIGGVTATDPSTIGWSSAQLGAIWYNSQDNVYKYWNGTDIITISASPFQYNYKTMSAMQDDFISGGNSSLVVGILGWFLSGGTSLNSSEENAPGIISRVTGTTANTNTLMILSGSQNILPFNAEKTLLFIARTQNDSEVTARIGASNSFTSVQPGTGVYFEKLPADTTWFIVARNSNVETRIDTFIPVKNSIFDTFEILLQSENTAAIMKINNKVVGTLTTNTPTAVFITPGVHIINASTTSKTLSVDYFQLVIRGITR